MIHLSFVTLEFLDSAGLVNFTQIILNLEYTIKKLVKHFHCKKIESLQNEVLFQLKNR